MSIEGFAKTVNDFSDHLPKGRGRCFDIGSWGGCGVSCGAFLDGECTIPEEIPYIDIVTEYGEEEALEITKKYKKGTWGR